MVANNYFLIRKIQSQIKNITKENIIYIHIYIYNPIIEMWISIFSKEIHLPIKVG